MLSFQRLDNINCDIESAELHVWYGKLGLYHAGMEPLPAHVLLELRPSVPRSLLLYA
jgi:hypothetical protein